MSMLTKQSPDFSPQAARQLELFRYSPMRQNLLRDMLRLIRSTDGKKCLEIGSDGGAFSLYLRNSGGAWETLLTSPGAVEATRSLVPENVNTWSPTQIPFENKMFDFVVLVDATEFVENLNPLIEECHRVLHTHGLIVLNVPCAVRAPVLRALRRRLDRKYPESAPLSRREFSKADLFEMLKMGFDVVETRGYAHFFSELTHIMLQTAVRSIPADDPGHFDRRIRLHRIAGPFFRFALQLDYLLYPLRGNHLVALAKRHSWRPRNSPVLKDAASVTGAVLHTVR